jgi:UDP-2,4-diacetamido-2,4,6-trideoxy-beta-L-altropyranose hydrolase
MIQSSAGQVAYCMKIIFRTDASESAGSGHIMRCLTLASELKKRGAEVSFICRDLPRKLYLLVEKSGYTIHLLPSVLIGPIGDEVLDAFQTQAFLENEHCEVDWLVVDHYGLSADWESKMRPLIENLLVIDDLADRAHICDVLVDDNLIENYEHRYETLVPKPCMKLLGPKYNLIRSDFASNAQRARKSNRNIRTILITMGGSDALNMTGWLLRNILGCDLPNPLNLAVVAGPTFRHLEEAENIASSSRDHTINIRQNVEDMATIMGEADLAISAGGQTCYELVLSGVPTIVLAANDSQHEIVQELHRLGAIAYLGVFASDLGQVFRRSFTSLIHDEVARNHMIASGRNIIDARGAERVSDQMFRTASHHHDPQTHVYG